MSNSSQLLNDIALLSYQDDEDKILAGIRHLDTRYFAMMRVFLSIAVVGMYVSMYRYLYDRMSSDLGVIDILAHVFTILHIICFLVAIQKACDWKVYRFRKSIIMAYNSVIFRIFVFTIMSFMHFKLIPGLNYYIMRFSFGLGYQAVVKIWGLGWNNMLKVGVILLIVLIISIIYYSVLMMISRWITNVYASDRISKLYVKD